MIVIKSEKALKYIEDMEKSIIKSGIKDADSIELSEDDEVAFFMISTEFEKDSIFRAYMNACLGLFSESTVRGVEALDLLFESLEIIANQIKKIPLDEKTQSMLDEISKGRT